MPFKDPEKRKAKQREYYQKHKKEKLEKNKKWRDEKQTKEMKSEYSARFYKKNKEKLSEYNKKYMKERYKSDPLFRIRRRLSASFRQFIKNKDKSLFEDNKKEDYFKILRERFLEEYPDKNFEECLLLGDYHIDHIVPVSSAKSDEELILLYQPINLRLISEKENLNKKDKIDEELIEKYGLTNISIDKSK